MVVHIANTFDKNRLGQYYALLASIFSNNPTQPFHFHVVVSDIPESKKLSLKKYVEKNGSQLTYYSIETERLAAFPLGSKWTVAVYYRLLLFELLPKEITRLLYLDTDTLVLNELTSFYSIELRGHTIAAVYDNYVKERAELGIIGEQCYFNSGMMLIDLSAWTSESISIQAINYLSQYPERIKFVDQDALNVVLKEKWLKMSEAYNFMYTYIPDNAPASWYRASLPSIFILHFTLQRPWNMLCKNRYRRLYRSYFKQSGVQGEGAVVDFDVLLLGQWAKLRLVEMYQDVPSSVKNNWKGMKRRINQLIS